MDTIGREGCRIEIQAMYALMHELLGSLTGEEQWEKDRAALRELIKRFFFKRGTLWDGHTDETIRPNVFITYLLQPDLLTATEWERVFGTALSALRTTWGGLTSVDRRDPGFVAISSGEDNRSYHKGDSWFFINNLAALALHRINIKQFKPVVEELLASSTKEILWKHVAGQAGEIASANDGTSWGCGTQAFSAGTFRLLTEDLGY
jgi:glycogen debranching enzyme